MQDLNLGLADIEAHSFLCVLLPVSLVQGAGGLRQSCPWWNLSVICSISEAEEQDCIFFLELP